MAGLQVLSDDELAAASGGQATEADVQCTLAAARVKDRIRWTGGNGQPLMPVLPVGDREVGHAERVCRGAPAIRRAAHAARLVGAPVRPFLSFALSPEGSQ